MNFTTRTIFTISLFLIFCVSLNAQTDLNFTGLTTSNSLSGVTIGSTGYTFDAVVSGTSSTQPSVNASGRLIPRFTKNTSEYQCIAITLKDGSGNPVTGDIIISNENRNNLNAKDSFWVNSTSASLTDPNSLFASGTTASTSWYVPTGSGREANTTWDVTTTTSSLTVCGARAINGGTGNNNSVPLNISVDVTTLPVSLISFSGVRLEDNIALRWATASELNNDYFLLERSSDGQDFVEINTITGKGSSQDITEYEYLDFLK